MGNEAYLILTYFLTGLISFCLGLAAYGWLRHPLGQIADAQPRKEWGNILKKFFPISTLILALAAFMSVSYSDGCPARPYERIIADRAYMVAKNQQQISATREVGEGKVSESSVRKAAVSGFRTLRGAKTRAFRDR